MSAPLNPVWARAMIALQLAALDPAGLGGILLRARAGPVRDAFLDAVARLPNRTARLHPAMPEDALTGGLDIEATLGAGRIVRHAGLASHDGALLLVMAERLTPRGAARLAGMLDAGRPHPLIALDEGAGPEEAAPAALSDRLAFHLDLEGLSLAETAALTAPLPAPAHLPLPAIADGQIESIAHLAEALGVASPRAACLAMRAAQAHAALIGRAEVLPEDLELASVLVLVPRATRVPPAEEDSAEDPPPPEDGPESDAPPPDRIPDDILIAAARALLPDDLLARVAAARQRRGKGSGSGAGRVGRRRGRPLVPRPGRLDGQARIDLVATLRAAAPWQKPRRAAQPHRTGILIRPADIHLRRYEETADRLLIFAVDASGSAALTRLAEAKGAVELMLATAYARRDHVALVAFRGETAELLLPPTRSLVRTKRELASLPGGGATPLALGLKEALALAGTAQGRGMTPLLAILTDGRANIALDGRPDRAAAMADAETQARAIAARGVQALVIDMGTRPEAALAALARSMAADYLALPRADARRISSAVGAALDG